MWRKGQKIRADSSVLLGLAALVAVLVTLDFLANRIVANVIEAERVRTHARSVSNAVALARGVAAAPDLATMQNTCLALATQERLIQVRVIDDANHDIIPPIDLRASEPDVVSGKSADTLGNVILAKLTSTESPRSVRYYRDKSLEMEFVAAPALRVLPGEQQIATVVLVSRNTVLAALERAGNILLAMGVAATLLLGLIIVTLYRAAVRPLQRIQSAVAGVGVHTTDAAEGVDEVTAAYSETITRLEESEARLRDAHLKLKASYDDLGRLNSYLMETMSDGVILLDEAGKILGVNAMAARRLDVPPRLPGLAENISDSHYSSCFAANPAIVELIDVALTNREPRRIDIERIDENGASIALRCSVIILEHDEVESVGKAPRGILVLVEDQTELARANKRLELGRQLASLGEMAAGLAHQLRNSISAAMGFGAIARRKLPPSDLGAAEAVEALLKELGGEAELVDRFLNFAKPLRAERALVNIKDFLSDCLQGYFARVETAPKVAFLQAPENIECEIDSLLLKQALVNLVDNAITASPPDTQPVEVSARIDDGNVVITVKDHGIGIVQDNREKIFTPFFSTSALGAGLGLPLARKIVELHHGRLDFQSVPGVGTTFEVTLAVTSMGHETTSALIQTSPAR